MSALARSTAAAALLAIAFVCVAKSEPPTFDFQIVHVIGRFAPTTPTFEVIRSAAKWVEFRKEAQIEGPEIDFQKYSLMLPPQGSTAHPAFLW